MCVENEANRDIVRVSITFPHRFPVGQACPLLPAADGEGHSIGGFPNAWEGKIHVQARFSTVLYRCAAPVVRSLSYTLAARERKK